jgi:Flp pilus assembly protein TadG
MTQRFWHRAGHDQRGAGDVMAMMFIVPLAFGVVLLFIYLGRQGSSVEGVSHAAHVAARAASMERDAASAQSAAHTAASSTLSAAGMACAGGPAVSMQADGWEPGGVVTVTVSCTVGTGDLGAIDAPSRTFTSSSRSVIDRYRGVR